MFWKMKQISQMKALMYSIKKLKRLKILICISSLRKIFQIKLTELQSYLLIMIYKLKNAQNKFLMFNN